MWKTIIQAIAFVAVMFIIVYTGVRVVKQQRANDLELSKLQVELDKSKEMLDELVSDTWKLKRDADYFIVRVWALWMIHESGLPLDIYPVKNLNFPPYASIFEPFIQKIHLDTA
jgi:hypothetical protein